MSTSLRLTLEEYDRMVAVGAFDQLDRRTELIHGEICEMSPAGPIHDDYVRFLNQWITSFLTPSTGISQIQSGIVVGQSIPEPDLAIVKPGRYLRRRVNADDALLVIEVAESSLSFDLGEKAALYASGGIAEYWVIDVAGSKLHRHQDPTANKYETVEIFTRADSLSLNRFPNSPLVLGDLFVA